MSENNEQGKSKQKPNKITESQIKKIEIEKLVKFKNHPFQTYEGERLDKLAYSIKEIGLQNPIIVRPIEGDKCEILSGHNRVEATKLLGQDTINAIIRVDISDEMAERIVIESNLNQQSFSDWKYTQQIRVIKLYSKYIQENSQQGKRTDLVDNTTSVHSEQKSIDKSKRLTARDKISKQLGISSTVFERYRSIAKLNDDIIDTLGKMLDEKRIGFMSAYRISQLKQGEIESVMSLLKINPEVSIKGTNIKLLYDDSKNSKDVELPKDTISEILLSFDPISSRYKIFGNELKSPIS